MGDDTALDARARQMAELAREGRYPSRSYLPALARGLAAFERGDFAAAIEALAPLAGENERIGGSRAQHDLIEFTLLKAYIDAGRLEEARRLLSERRPGVSGVPVMGVAGALNLRGRRGTAHPIFRGVLDSPLRTDSSRVVSKFLVATKHFDAMIDSLYWLEPIGFVEFAPALREDPGGCGSADHPKITRTAEGEARPD